MAAVKHPLFHPPIVRRALWEAVYKLDPRHMLRNPVMFVVLVGSALTTLVLIGDPPGKATRRPADAAHRDTS